MNHLERVKAYANGTVVLAQWVGSGGTTVDQLEAQRRADICIGCPQNQEGLKIAESAALAIRQQMELKNNLQLRTMREKSLYTCAACLCPLRLKIWLPLERILPDDELKPKLDPKCWLLEQKP